MIEQRREHDNSVSGNLSLADAIAKSSNVIMVRIMLMLNNDTVLNYFSNLGLGTKTGIDTYFESTKKLVESKKLNKVGKSTMGYGQGDFNDTDSDNDGIKCSY